LRKVLFMKFTILPLKTPYDLEVFYSTQYDLYDRLKKDSYVIEKDPMVEINSIRLIFLAVVR
jgi:hypothetical protein